jgi:multiple sugar transport system permease protein
MMTNNVVPVRKPSQLSRHRSRPHTLHDWRKSLSTGLFHGTFIAGALILLYPLLWMLVASFRPVNMWFDGADLWSGTATIENYINGWNALGYSFGLFIGNSLIICIGAIVGNVLSCSLVAFAFARLHFKFKRFWFAVMLCTTMLPAHVLIIPQYLLFKTLHWINTFLPLIVPRFFATDAFFIFLLTQFIRSIPLEIDDAARIDGCGPFQLFWRIILPIMMPALTITAIFTFIWTWNDFFVQLIFLNNASLYTVSVALRSFMDTGDASSIGSLIAMSMLSLVPVIGGFLACQNLLVESMATSGLKG